jgi:hypothetical protein
MRTMFLGVFLALFSVYVGAPQTTKPDFSGRWTMVSPEAGRQLIVKQDATTLTSGPPDAQQGPTVTFKLDGTESRNVMKTEAGEAVMVSRASWKNQELEVTSTIKWSGGPAMEQVIVWSIDERGQLVMQVQNKGTDAVRLIYRMTPAPE